MAQETEAKFHVLRLADLRRRLEGLGASLIEPRVLERNLRFDTPQRELGRAGRVLRLRQDRRIRLTYKDAGSFQAGSTSRRELEFAVSDFEPAREFLEALGYEVSLVYEKYRTTYEFDGLELMLDEMPYGDFVELEGQAESLETAAQRLGLKWAASIPESYAALFERVRGRLHLGFRDLTFENFKGIPVSADDLGVIVADE